MGTVARKTKIIATLGPSSSSVAELVALIDAGMDVVRINLSHGNRAGHADLIRHVKKAREKRKTQTAILLDTRGPEIRVVDMAEGIMLIEGRTIRISGSARVCDSERIGVDYGGIASCVRPGDRILFDDGRLVVKVEALKKGEIEGRVVAGGLLTGRKKVSLPGVIVDLPSLSAEDEADILFGIDEQVDFIAASFIRRRKDVLAIRRLLDAHGGTQHIIAKIETRQAVENLEEILDVADGLMVARGDLGVELAPEEVPLLQKKIIEAANAVGKPVITATQMLESMITSPVPTRAEASDVTNAVMDGTDAVMLSAETATGRYPLEAVTFLSRCAEMTESSLDYKQLLANGLRHARRIIPDAIAYASCALAADLDAAAILSLTASGSTARRVAMYRPLSQIVAASPDPAALRKLQLVRGVVPVPCAEGTTMDEQIDNGICAALKAGLIRKKDTLAVIASCPFHISGITNLLRVHTIGEKGLVLHEPL